MDSTVNNPTEQSYEQKIDIALDRVAEKFKAIVPGRVVTDLAEIVPAGLKALKLYEKEKVDEAGVVGIAFDLYTDLYFADSTGPVIEAADSLLADFYQLILGATEEESDERLKAAYLAPVRIRRLQLANTESALRIKWRQTSYRPPLEWKPEIAVMDDLNWFKSLKEGGYEPQLTWEHFYDFLAGYKRDGTIFVGSGSIFGLTKDLDDIVGNALPAEFQKDYKYRKQSWEDFQTDVHDFNAEMIALKEKDDPRRPKSYDELGDKLHNLHDFMQREVGVFEKYLPHVVKISEEVEKKIEAESRWLITEREKVLDQRDKDLASNIRSVDERVKYLSELIENINHRIE